MLPSAFKSKYTVSTPKSMTCKITSVIITQNSTCIINSVAENVNSMRVFQKHKGIKLGANTLPVLKNYIHVMNIVKSVIKSHGSYFCGLYYCICI